MKLIKPFLFLLSAVAVGAYFARGSWDETRAQEAEARKQEARMNAAEKERAALLRKEAEVSGPGGREALARTNGYRMPNEEPAPK